MLKIEVNGTEVNLEAKGNDTELLTELFMANANLLFSLAKGNAETFERFKTPIAIMLLEQSYEELKENVQEI